MQLSNDILIRLAVFVLGLLGFLVAKHIRDHKTKNTPLVCMVGFDCHTVVHSDYSKFLGFPVELGGMIYYVLVSVVSILSIFAPKIFPFVAANFLALASLTAFLFSLYLIGTQIFIIKKGCSWCIVSAILSTLIFILVFFL